MRISWPWSGFGYCEILAQMEFSCLTTRDRQPFQARIPPRQKWKLIDWILSNFFDATFFRETTRERGKRKRAGGHIK